MLSAWSLFHGSVCVLGFHSNISEVICFSVLTSFDFASLPWLQVVVKSDISLVPTGMPLIRLTSRDSDYLLHLRHLGDIEIFTSSGADYVAAHAQWCSAFTVSVLSMHRVLCHDCDSHLCAGEWHHQSLANQKVRQCKPLKRLGKDGSAWSEDRTLLECSAWQVSLP